MEAQEISTRALVEKEMSPPWPAVLAVGFVKAPARAGSVVATGPQEVADAGKAKVLRPV